jgi:hypothetical protein
LIDDKGRPQPRLKDLVAATPSGRETILLALVVEFYPFVGEQGRFLETMTPQELEKGLAAAGSGGQTVRKSGTFLLALARAAGIAVNPALKVTELGVTPSGTNNGSATRARKRDSEE